MKIWIAALAAFFSYSGVEAADQSPVQIHQLARPIASYPDAPVLGLSTHPNEVADPWMQQHSTLNIGQLAPEVDKQPWDPRAGAQSPSLLTDLERSFSPEVTSVPAYDLWQLETAPLMVEPGWIPVEGVFIGPGISFGIGFPVGFLGSVGSGEVSR